MNIHILLADDHQQYRHNLLASLDAVAGLQVVAVAEDGAALLQQVRDISNPNRYYKMNILII